MDRYCTNRWFDVGAVTFVCTIGAYHGPIGNGKESQCKESGTYQPVGVDSRVVRGAVSIVV